MRLDDANYYVDFGNGKAELAIRIGEQRIDIKDTVRGWWSDEAGAWLIKQYGETFKAFTYVYSTNYAPTTQPDAPAGRVWVRIREMLPDARQITAAWGNEPTSIDGYSLNGGFDDGQWAAGKIVLVHDVRFSPDGNRVAIAWSPYESSGIGYINEAHLALFEVNSAAREWGDLIADFRVDIATGFPGAQTPQFAGNSEAHGLGWSADGKYLALAVRNLDGGGIGTCVVVLGGMDATPYLADFLTSFVDYPDDGFVALGAVEFSPDGAHLFVGRFGSSAPSGETIGDMCHFDVATETLTWVQPVIAFNATADFTTTHAIGWTPDSQTMFVGIVTTQGAGSPFLGSLAAIPVNANSTLGPPEYEQRWDTRDPSLSPATRLGGSTVGLEVHPDGVHVLVQFGGGFFYVVPWNDGTQAPGDTSRWGWPRTQINGTAGGQTPSGFQYGALTYGVWQIFWLDGEYILTSPVSAGRWRALTNTTRSNGDAYVIEDGEVATFEVNRILKWPQPPKTVKFVIPAPDPNSIVIVHPSALSDDAP